MKNMYLMIVFLFLQSCVTIVDKDKKQKYTNDFTKDFKSSALCECILFGYRDKEITTKMVHEDSSFYDPVIGSLFSKELRKIGLDEYKIMQKDSLESIETFSEAKAGKEVMFHCLKFYSSKKLDSITKIQYKKWKKLKNIDSLVQVKNLAF